MDVVIAAGGTGGHFYAGLAVARELLSAGNTVRFFVKTGDYVIPLLQREKIPFSTIPAQGILRRLSLKNILVLPKLIFGVLKSLFLFLIKKPNHVLVMGGYLSVPPALAAKMLGIPVLLHEQNVIPGLANRILSRITGHVAVSFSASVPYFRGKIYVTGNPVRAEFKNLPSRIDSLLAWKLDPKKKTVLVFGGSLGAHRLNILVTKAANEVILKVPQLQFIHFTGKGDESLVQDAYTKAGVGHHVETYCHNMSAAYAASDLVICRSGASTVTELMAVQKPALLIPYPYATNNHQRANADVLGDLGAAHVIEEKELSVKMLEKILLDLLTQTDRLSVMNSAFSHNQIDPFLSAHRISEIINPPLF
jgi:UDP-N-acetylglucosamine--N-acetylmuramyl-(pentapeptide) pyrophosphoryl-undecaprenol N-acetylglucosamine transferase